MSIRTTRIVIALFLIAALAACSTYSSSRTGWITFSPDAENILFPWCFNDRPCTLAELDLNSGETHLIKNVPETFINNARASYSPDGSRLVFSINEPGTNNIQIATINRDGSNYSQLTRGYGARFHAEVLPDNETTVFKLKNGKFSESRRFFIDGPRLVSRKNDGTIRFIEFDTEWCKLRLDLEEQPTSMIIDYNMVIDDGVKLFSQRQLISKARKYDYLLASMTDGSCIRIEQPDVKIREFSTKVEIDQAHARIMRSKVSDQLKTKWISEIGDSKVANSFNNPTISRNGRFVLGTVPTNLTPSQYNYDLFLLDISQQRYSRLTDMKTYAAGFAISDDGKSYALLSDTERDGDFQLWVRREGEDDFRHIPWPKKPVNYESYVKNR
ncbi:MAG: PD40 domain-containing protein [Rhodospirillales bacterium]|nr:PD40 domain-containing protein [Rhodospirillales bacterium]MBO6788151.1 PD40 domain-containing protein [Rhodospirillales bacterium]